ncbi:AAA family ATPase [Tropicimonas sediminicola]|uniref:DNA repair exonuclease SbcCD ATPase subunit n=1 Tax=Tropicimonas sediminicola TaxID=1031541 RepID=A0A239K6B9_9RHOB|nr:AAA family ATPase [Tropicimonas sediminicola]SNT13163.1 DNA repair exonuclease SbcCD ATPase subunit [Tropicimonas sediminicola]
MKLLSIRLQNVRRFTTPVEIGGIGPGLNVLSAPNESGKSTVFDALHALFFKDRKAWDKELRALQPHAGGDPEVSVTLESGGQTYRIEKSWTKGRRGEIRVFRDGHLAHQADDAEAWLAGLLTAPKDGGPAGLLWVRQGLLGLADGKETETARRDLATSVTGEIEAMTGGRQMDDILRHCRSELDGYVTSRGARKGGPLDDAETRVATLEAREAELRARAAALRQDLDNRSRLRRELEGLNDPEEAAERQQKLGEAEAAHAAALRHAEDLDRARAAEQSARLALENHAAATERLAAQLAEAREAAAHLAEAEQRLAAAREVLTGKDAAWESARRAHEAASKEAEAASHRHRRALKAEQAAQAATRRQELEQRLATASDRRSQVETLAALAQQGLSADGLQQIEALALELSVARKALETAAPAVVMRYAEGRGDGVSLDGRPLPDSTRIALPEGGRLDIAGIGALHVHPGAGADGSSVETALAELDAALVEHGLASLDEARRSARDRAASEVALREARAALKLAAPDGLEALQAALAALPAPVETEDGLPGVAEAEQAEIAARQALQIAATALESARRAAEEVRQAEARASMAGESAAARADRAALALAGKEDPQAALDGLRAAHPALSQAVEDARARRAALETDAPDLDAAQATLQRLTSAMKAAEARSRQIENDLAGLESRIEIQAGEAVDEELSEVQGQLEAARAQHDAVRFEVDVLQRLAGALERARTEARDRYVQPVLAELEPLVRMIWPEAELRFDADTLLPSGLSRTGTEEPFDVLSGGTQEQIALLVRLAFARILARSGTPAPVILDDAIVYTDDDRIEAIFDALTRQANDLQIIVLSCRQKAFRDLGGTALAIRHVAAG